MEPQASLLRFVFLWLDGLWSFTNMRIQDFTEVDNNVTRNIADELENNDWGLMVLHYLGLDHIGHKAGPRRCVL